MPLMRRYSVRRRSETRDGRGVRLDEYAHQFYLWGEHPREGSTTIVPEISGRTSTDTLRLRARYRTGVQMDDQLVSDDLTMYVTSVLDLDGRKKWLQITATLRPAGVPA